MNKFKKYLKLFFFTICVIFLFYQFTNIFPEILGKVQTKISKFFFLLFLTIIFFNIINLRAFLLIKSSIGYAYSYSDWSKLYFESLIASSLINVSGTLYRAIQLKKRDVSYTIFIVISYLLLGSYILISLMFISLELFFIKKKFYVVYIFLAAILVFIFFFGLTILADLIKFFLKIKILSRYLESARKLSEILKKNFSKKKTIIILYLNTIIVHISEIVIFYFVSIFFLNNVNIEIIVILFAINFIVDRVPFFAEIPGFGEIILGITGVSLGIIFTDGAIVKLTIRFLNYLSILLNSGVYFVISYFDKNKFVEV